MKTRQTLLFGLAGLGFVLAMPAQAGSTASFESPASIVQGFVIAARDKAEARQEQRRDLKDDERGRASRNQQIRELRESERFYVPPEYGYGYERRQQPHPSRDEGRHRR